MNAADPLIFCRALDLDNGAAPVNDGRQHCARDIVNLYFGGEENGVVCWEGIGAESGTSLISAGSALTQMWSDLQHREVGKVVDICTHVRLRAAALLPLLIQCFAIPPCHFHRSQELLHLEARCKDDCIKFCLGTILTDDTRLIYSFDTRWNHLDVWVVEALEVVGIKDATFASYSSSDKSQRLDSQCMTYLEENQEQ
jgi:hypothetical protein